MKAVVYSGSSLDGFIAGKDGDFDWLVQFTNAIIIGSGTFKKALWPVLDIKNETQNLPGRCLYE